MAEAAKKLGVSASLIRRYEREFELSFARTEQGRCLLSDQDLANLKIIRAYRQQNLPLEEIKVILNRPAMVAAETETFGPDIKEVIKALVSRQDELEALVKAQGIALDRLSQENRHLLATNQDLSLRLEAPGAQGLAARLDALENRARTAEASLDAETKDEMIRKLQRRLLDLEAAVATEITHHDDDAEGILDELARAIQAQGAAPRKKWWRFWG
ncbi:MAG TPA: MerR family transcriptional regulator [Pantanalinema sp.]